ncbi:MAG: peptidase [Ignavibacteriae bacterium HGW-Ignavibacteriae-3]|nr:MAG: peptidase [Ignavibacteriae bacterium HGW-Ignavibacteriae-3]
MTSRNAIKHRKFIQLLFILLFTIPAIIIHAQDRLPKMPGYEKYQIMSPQIRNAVKSDWRFLEWNKEGTGFSFFAGGKTFNYSIDTKIAVEAVGAQPPQNRFRGMAGRPERGRQYTSVLSPDKTINAFYRARNVWLSDADGKNEIAVTTGGNEKDRIKYGSASWVYGEELYQSTAMWWSPDNKKIAFYKFDESKVKDYYLQFNQLKLQDSVDVEPYVKVGGNNPVVDIFVYDLDSKKTTQIDVRDGQPFSNNVTGHYIYGIEWSKDGKALLYHRTNRKQNIMEYMAADPETGKSKLVVREEWLPSYTKNTPDMEFLSDGNRFIWTSERTGYLNYYLYDLSGKLLSTITKHNFEVAGIVKIDEENNTLYYMARSGDNHMKLQLHKVGFDGKGDVKITNPAFNHSVNISPDYKYIVDISQTHDIPPFVNLRDIKGKEITNLFTSDETRFKELGLTKTELFTFKAADGVTDLHGMLSFPSNFDPSEKYPLLVSVYGGPETNGAREIFSAPNPLAEFGFVIASFDSRSAAGRGKKFMDPYYGNLGIVEMDDQAEGVKYLGTRPYINKERVGIFGTSYGGTASAMCLLRFPDLFHAAVANSGVMDFRNYDNIYTERHQGLADENSAGYDRGNAMTYAKNLKGHLMIYYGTSDNNVHPANSLQLIDALQREGKSFEVQVGPDKGHTAVNRDRMMEFFIEHLIMN